MALILDPLELFARLKGGIKEIDLIKFADHMSDKKHDDFSVLIEPVGQRRYHMAVMRFVQQAIKITQQDLFFAKVFSGPLSPHHTDRFIPGLDVCGEDVWRGVVLAHYYCHAWEQKGRAGDGGAVRTSKKGDNNSKQSLTTADASTLALRGVTAPKVTSAGTLKWNSQAACSDHDVDDEEVLFVKKEVKESPSVGLGRFAQTSTSPTVDSASTTFEQQGPTQSAGEGSMASPAVFRVGLTDGLPTPTSTQSFSHTLPMRESSAVGTPQPEGNLNRAPRPSLTLETKSATFSPAISPLAPGSAQSASQRSRREELQQQLERIELEMESNRLARKKHDLQEQLRNLMEG